MRIIIPCIFSLFLLADVHKALTVESLPAQSVCVFSSHSHAVHDYRNMKVRIEAVSWCGLRVEDLEEHTILAEPFLYDEKFGFGIVKGDKVTELDKKSIRKGMVGIITYCEHCKRLLLFRLFEK